MAVASTDDGGPDRAGSPPLGASPPDAQHPEARPPSSWWRSAWVRGVAVLALALGSLVVLELALPAAFLVFLASVSIRFGALSGRLRRTTTALLLLAGAVSMVSTTLFLVQKAVPGIIAGGNRATARTAVSRLREVLFAQDVARRRGTHDPDGDGVGSALFLGELLGHEAVRGGLRLEPPLLAPTRFPTQVRTSVGPAHVGPGYLFVVCLPTPGGGWTAVPGATVDDEHAERRYVAYAWPSATAYRIHDAFFIDEHERILTSDNTLPNGEPRLAGPNHPPACDDALADSTRSSWRVWRDKRPREELPGAD